MKLPSIKLKVDSSDLDELNKKLEKTNSLLDELAKKGTPVGLDTNELAESIGQKLSVVFPKSKD